MLHVVLFEPEIPPNTGNIIRLCANTGSVLHLIEPLGFTLDDARMRRAGLDYHEFANILVHKNYESFKLEAKPTRIFACSTKGHTNYTQAKFTPNDAILMGPETRGLPSIILDQLTPSAILHIPMRPDSRSLNLANATAVILYEALRQLEFAGLA